jgi:hypothetical protein
MADTVNVQGDPLWGKGLNSIAGMFDPKAEAQGASVLATTRYNNAKAAGVEDQNNALSDAYLAAAGYSPAEIAAARATRDNSLASFGRGINEFRGREALIKGDTKVALPLLGQANAYDDYTKGEMVRRLTTNPDGTLNMTFAPALAAGVTTSGGVITQLGEDGKFKIIDTTPAGKVDLGRIKTDKAESEAKIKLMGTRETNLGRLTDAQIALLKSKGVAVEYLTEAKVGAIENAANNATAESEARIALTNLTGEERTRLTNAQIARLQGLTNTDKLKADAEAARANLNDQAKQLTVRKGIEDIYAKDFAENLGTANAWEQVDPAQKKSLTDRAMQYILRDKLDVMAAMRKSEADHKITGSMVKGKKDVFWGLKQSDNGKISFEGFTVPEALADVVASGAAPTSTPAAPVIAPAAGAAPAAAAAPAVTADTPRITDDAAGREAWGKLAPGTVYVAPDGSVRTKE